MTDRNERGGRDYGRDRDRGAERGGRGEPERSTRGREPEARQTRDSVARRDRGDRESERGQYGGRDRDEDRGGSGSSQGFVYKPRTAESVEKRANQSSKEYDRFLKDGVKIFTPAKGDNRIRILPATWKDADHYGMNIWVHYGVGPDRSSYLDLSKMLDKPDPITEEMEELRRTGASDDEVRELESRKRVLVYVIDRDNETDGVQAYPMPWGMDKDISVLSRDRDTGGIINVDDPEEGFDIEFRRDGEGLKTKYSAFSIARRPSRLGKPEWLDYAIDNPLPDQLVYFGYDEIAKVFGGGGAHREPERGGRDDPPERGRERGRDELPRRDEPERGRERGRATAAEEPKLTWADVHAMTSAELDALVASDDRLRGIKVNDAASDAELADWICEDLKIAKEEPRGRNRAPEAGAGRDDDLGERMRELRASQGRR